MSNESLFKFKNSVEELLMLFFASEYSSASKLKLPVLTSHSYVAILITIYGITRKL